MQAYPGSGNPVIDALAGRISDRQLRVMLENLPPDNPVAWEYRDGDTWGETEWLLHDVSSALRALVTGYSNVHRAKGKPERETEYLPTLRERLDKHRVSTDTRPREQVQAERDHLQAVLARTAAKRARK